MNAALLALIGLFVYQVKKPWMLWAAGAVALFANLPAEIRTPGEFLLQYGEALLPAVCALAFCLWFARRNYLAYALVLWIMALRGPLLLLLGSAIPALQIQGWILAAIVGATMLWAVSSALLRRNVS